MRHSIVDALSATLITLAACGSAGAQPGGYDRPGDVHYDGYGRIVVRGPTAPTVPRGGVLRRVQASPSRTMTPDRGEQDLERMVAAFCSDRGPRTGLTTFRGSILPLCAFDGSPTQGLSFSDLRPASADAQDAINEMLQANGVQASIPAYIGPVQNAEARVMGSNPVILYSPSFFQELVGRTGKALAVLSVLAHEIGHHANFDTFSQMRGDPHSAELRADYFSGSMMARLGASEEDVLAAMKTIATDRDTTTHPARSRRLAAISRGYRSISPRTRQTPRVPDGSDSDTTPDDGPGTQIPGRQERDRRAPYPYPGPQGRSPRIPDGGFRYPGPTPWPGDGTGPPAPPTRGGGIPDNLRPGMPMPPGFGMPMPPGFGMPMPPGFGMPMPPEFGMPMPPEFGMPMPPGFGMPMPPGFGMPAPGMMVPPPIDFGGPPVGASGPF